MKPIEFEEQNCVFAENQPEYLPLPAFKDSGKEGYVIFCMSMSLKERIKVLLTGRVWISLMMFGKPLTPFYSTVNKKDILISKER